MMLPTPPRPSVPLRNGLLEATMRQKIGIILALLLLSLAGQASGQRIGKFVPVQAGSEADHALTEISQTTDLAQKLVLIDKFATGPSQGDLAIVAENLYVEYYLGQKTYAKVFEHGDKLFLLDPDNFSNALNMIRAASDEGDVERLFSYGEKGQRILQRFKATPAPAGNSARDWEQEKVQTLESNKDGIVYLQQVVYSAAFQAKDVTKRAGLLVRFAQIFPDSPYADPALGVAATAYQQAQDAPKMLEVANGLLIRDPNNLGMLLLLADYYSEKGEQLDKAAIYAKRAVTVLEGAKKPEDLTDDQWRQQSALQKGLALSALGQTNIQKKDNAQAVENFKAAAPLLKSDDGSYGRNQYRMGFALLNLKNNAAAKEAFTQAASVNSPYKALAQEKLKAIAGAGSPGRKKS
jgi:tetratricopeptide (TPR) repeat protein